MRKSLVCLSLFLLFLSLSAFGADDKLAPVSGVDPSAMGSIHTDNDKNGNVHVKLNIQHLADPAKLSPPHQSYMAWIVPNGGTAQALGEIRPGKKEGATLTGITPSKNFDVLVTAEDLPNPTEPSSTVVLRGHVEAK